MRAKGPSRLRERRSARARPARAGPAAWDRRLTLLVAGIIIAVLLYVRSVVHPAGAMFWSYQVVMLCLVAAAAAGRALLGPQPETEGGDDRWRRVARAAVPLIVCAGVLPYLPTLTIGFLSDDFGLTSSIAHSGGPAHLLGTRPFPILWRPAHAIAWWAQYQLWGAAPAGYHAIAILFHAANAVLVYLLGRRITAHFPAALFAGLLFAVHPAHAATVAWASCQPDLQCTLFALLSLLCLEVFLASPRRGRRALALAAALLTFFLALTTKEAALALPGVAALRAGLAGGRRRRWRTAGISAGYGAVLALYLGLRVVALGRFGGYRLLITFWNSAFPSAPLRQAVEFFFPINQPWLGATAPWLWWPLLAAMGAFLLWCIGQLPRLPARRLLLYAGFVVLMAVPVWAYPALSADLEYVRFAYLPTIGLTWLVGEVLAAGAGRRRAYASVGMAAAAVLCLWWVMPWRAAGQLVGRITAAGKDMVEQTPASARRPVFFVEDLPDTAYGALIFRNGFPQALTMAVGAPVLAEVVGKSGDVPSEVMSLSDLLPGEYLFAWEAGTKKMKLVRAGSAEGVR
jgi:hypothetical protein